MLPPERQPEKEHQGRAWGGDLVWGVLPADIVAADGDVVSALRQAHIGAYLGSPLPSDRPCWRL